MWNGSTRTPLERPRQFRSRSAFTPQEAAEYLRGSEGRVRSRLPTSAVEDPDTWATPWTAEWPFHATDVPLFSVECHEGNHAIENILRGARDEERRAADPRR